MLYPKDRTSGQFKSGYPDSYVDSVLDKHTGMDVLIFSKINMPFAEIHYSEEDEADHMRNLTVARINRTVHSCWQAMKDCGINADLLEFDDGRPDHITFTDSPFGLRPLMGVDIDLQLGWVIVTYRDHEIYDLDEEDMFNGQAKTRWYPSLRNAYARVAGLIAVRNAWSQTEQLCS